MNFVLFQENSIEMGEVMRALEEIEGIWQDGDSMGFVEDESSEYYGSWIYVADNDYSLDDIQTMFTEQLGYDLVDSENGDVLVMYRMNTVVQIHYTPREVTFYIDHSSPDEDFDLDYEDE